MQRRKLDLSYLLTQYQNITNNITSSPLRQHKNKPTELEFTPRLVLSRALPEAPPLQDNPKQPTQPIQTNFALSKSEIESFLISVREQIRVEERQLAKCEPIALKIIVENFNKSMEKMKKQVFQTLQKGFEEMETNLRQQLLKQSKKQSILLSTVHDRISAFDQDINRLLNKLKSADYRKTIAEVITRDFNLEMNELKNATAKARGLYLQYLPKIEVDQSKIELVNNCLQNMIVLERKSKEPSNYSAREYVDSLYSNINEKSQSLASESGSHQPK